MSQSTHKKVSKILPSIPSRPSTAILVKSKYNQGTKIFTQITKNNAVSILKIRKAFPSLLSKNIIKIYSIGFSNKPYSCPKLSVTTKRPLQKHILISISKENKDTILYWADIYVRIINSYLKLVNLLHQLTAKVTSFLDLTIMEKYFKGFKEININNNITPHLPQSKSYFKILGVSFYRNNLSASISNT